MDLCWEHRLYGPMLILLFSTIDALAWLTCSHNQPDVKAADFMRWVDQYLMPGSGLPCTSSDLYAARCGLVHSLTPDARKIGEGHAQDIYYAVGPDRAKLLQYGIDNSKEQAIAVLRAAKTGSS
jgi:hypothetical protein